MFYEAIRNRFLEYCPADASNERRMAGAQRFAEHFALELGLQMSPVGRPVIREQQINPNTFSLRGLAESLVGYEWVESLGRHQAAGMRVFEAAGTPAIVPGQIPNVSAFLGSVVGLLQAEMISAYDKPEYIIDELVEVVPSKTRQHKLIGLGRIGDQSKKRNPGEGHPFANFEERYSTTPETSQDALAGAVTFEAVFFDQTQETLGQMRSIGDELGLRKELDGMAMIAGVTNPYNYRGTAYNTYLTSGNWINDQSNELLDWTSINTSLELASRLTDQESGNRVSIAFDTMLVSPNKFATAGYIKRATQVESLTQTNQVERRFGANEVPQFNIKQSVYMDQVLTATAANGGLALTQANANKYWWLLKTGRNGAFTRTENWPMTIEEAAPNDFTMRNQKLLLAVFADQMHAFGVREPRAVQRNKN